MLWLWETVSWETWKRVPFSKPLKQRKDPKPHSLRANREKSQKTPTPKYLSAISSLLLLLTMVIRVEQSQVRWCSKSFPSGQQTAYCLMENAVSSQRYLHAQTVWAISTAVTTRSTWMRTSLYVPARQSPPRLQKLNTKARLQQQRYSHFLSLHMFYFYFNCSPPVMNGSDLSFFLFSPCAFICCDPWHLLLGISSIRWRVPSTCNVACEHSRLLPRQI